MRSVFRAGPSHPAPRTESHYMYRMSARVEVPVTTLADGTSLIIICPQSGFSAAYSANFYSPPFITVPSGSTSAPFVAAPIYSPAGPFFGQLANVSKYAVDSLTVDFIET